MGPSGHSRSKLHRLRGRTCGLGNTGGRGNDHATEGDTEEQRQGQERRQGRCFEAQAKAKAKAQAQAKAEAKAEEQELAKEGPRKQKTHTREPFFTETVFVVPLETSEG